MLETLKLINGFFLIVGLVALGKRIADLLHAAKLAQQAEARGESPILIVRDGGREEE